MAKESTRPTQPHRAAAAVGEGGRSEVRTPTVSVYQNSEHVAGLLQQLLDEGLLLESEQGWQQGATATKGAGGTASTKIDGKAGLVPLGAMAASLMGDLHGDIRKDNTSANNYTRRIAYSQAYYLHKVKSALRAQGLIKSTNSKDDVERLVAGDMVEFRATFAADEASAMLDVATPELIAAVARYSERRKTAKGIGSDSFDDFDARTRYLEKRRIEEEATVDLASAVAGAIRTDFRSDSTSQYYADMSTEEFSGKAMALVVCETEHFLVKDRDRLLDGQFLVLGKVVLAAQPHINILDRNKLLSRIRPDAVEYAFSKVAEMVDQRAPVQPNSSAPEFPGNISAPGAILDASFKAKVEGPVVTIMPIAVYA